MNNQEPPVRFSQQIQLGAVAAYKALVAFKKNKQRPLIISRDGKIVAVVAEHIPPSADRA